MIYNILTEGYFNPKTKRDSVSIEDTKSRVQTVTANKFVQDLCNDIRGDRLNIYCTNGGAYGYYVMMSDFANGNSENISKMISTLKDPIRFLFYCIDGMLHAADREYNTANIQICYKSDPDDILFKIDDPELLNDFYHIYPYISKNYPVLNYYIPWYSDYPDKYTEYSGGSIRTEQPYVCSFKGKTVYELCTAVTRAIEDYMNDIDSDSQTNSSNFWNILWDIRYKKLYDAFQNALDKEFKIHQGKPSLMNVLKSVVTDNGGITDMLKNSFAKLSDCISSQLPVRIDIIPAIEFGESVIDVAEYTLKKFPDMFSEGTELDPDQKNFRFTAV